jgi:DNA phosphorothioation-dependent restriction protein DptG
MPKEKPIHKMVDEVFDKELETDLFDEIVEERNFIVNTLKTWIETDAIWEQMVENKEERKQFLMHMQMLFLTELENSTLIELATTKHGDK